MKLSSTLLLSVFAVAIAGKPIETNANTNFATRDGEINKRAKTIWAQFWTDINYGGDYRSLQSTQGVCCELYLLSLNFTFC